MKTITKTFALLLLVCSFAIPGSKPQQHKLILSVYYESLCSDSRNFILQQLIPAMEELYNYVELRLIPFGKAKSINGGYGGFQCQHGAAECFGNLVQDCTLYHMGGQSDLAKLSYVACEMSTQAGARNDLSCVLKAGIPVQLVQQCLQTTRGLQLQLNSEYETKMVTGPPWPQFIPTVTIDMQFDQNIQNYAMRDLPGLLCNILQQTPAACGNSNVIHYVFQSRRLNKQPTSRNMVEIERPKRHHDPNCTVETHPVNNPSDESRSESVSNSKDIA